MTDYKELITALKCSTKVREGKCDENCPYRTLEEVKLDFPLPADVTINGIGYWESCDCDRMVLDAADAIEQLVKERDAAIEDLREVSLGDRGECFACKHRNGTGCRAYSDGVCWECWQWRGVKEAEHEAD